MIDLQRVATRVRRRIDESWNTILSLKCKSSFYSRKTAGPWDMMRMISAGAAALRARAAGRNSVRDIAVPWRLCASALQPLFVLRTCILYVCGAVWSECALSPATMRELECWY